MLCILSSAMHAGGAIERNTRNGGIGRRRQGRGLEEAENRMRGGKPTQDPSSKQICARMQERTAQAFSLPLPLGKHSALKFLIYIP